MTEFLREDDDSCLLDDTELLRREEDGRSDREGWSLMVATFVVWWLHRILMSWMKNGPGKRMVIKDNDLVIKMSLKNLYIFRTSQVVIMHVAYYQQYDRDKTTHFFADTSVALMMKNYTVVSMALRTKEQNKSFELTDFTLHTIQAYNFE